jgi:HAD superfamily hydrolase (TIGR01509 family)
MIKAIIFDLDNVLVETDKLHFAALNEALEANGVNPLTWQEHSAVYKGLPTRTKLEIMCRRRGLSPDRVGPIQHAKAASISRLIEYHCEPDAEKLEMLRMLSRRGYRLAVCSNATRVSVEQMLQRTGLLDQIEFFLSNQDVSAPKPSPEIYQLAFERLGIEPVEALIVEDSDAGITAARAAGAHVCPVTGTGDVNFYSVLAALRAAQRVTVVVPAAGDGKRFAEVGYVHPKPLIDVEGRPMICQALDNFEPLQPRLVTIMQREHVRRYRTREVLGEHYAGIGIVEVEGRTEGAACTVLLAEPHLDPLGELILANSDQTVDIDIREFVDDMRRRQADGGIMVFRDTHPKWSFARTDASGRVVEVAEKRPISDLATVGIYYFRRSAEFVRAARQMIEKNIRVNGEFYVCPVFNEMIEAGLKILVHEIDSSQMHGLGTPEDLSRFLEARTGWQAFRAA